jgi:aubergine-like protein
MFVITTSVYLCLGSFGRPKTVYTNTFMLRQAAGRSICQYHVHYNPPVESRGLRSRLINEQKELLGPVKIFDGMILYLGKKLEQPKTTFVGQTRDGDAIQVTIEFTGEVMPGTLSYMQILNVLMKRYLLNALF